METQSKREIERLVQMDNQRLSKLDKPMVQATKINTYGSPATKVYNDLTLKSTEAHEKDFSEEVTAPGDFCYKQIATASVPGGSSFSKKLVMTCPICNKIQILQQKVHYRYRSDWQTRLKFFANVVGEKVFKTIPFAIRGTVSVDGDITCQFNKLHVFTLRGSTIQSTPR
jgi:hypothetical protein